MTLDREGTETLRRSSQEPLGVVIQVAVGKSSPKSLRLTAGSCRVGADPENDIVIEDKAVSRAHLELSLVPEGVRVRDVGSRNGTFYAGQRVQDITLAPGSHLLLGATELVIQSDVESFEQTSADGPSQYANLIGKHPAMRR